MLRSPKSLNPRTVFKRSKLAELWRKRKISNFNYLMELNKIAGRTFNDIMQYPVFPWILAGTYSEKGRNRICIRKTALTKSQTKYPMCC